MPLPVIANTIRATVVGHCANQHKFTNVMHFRKTGALTFAGAIAILDPILLSHYTVNSGAGTSWRNAAPIAAGLELFEYTPLDGSTATSVFTHVAAGLDAGDPLPASIAIVVTLRTLLRGRRHRGRVYQGPFPETYNLAGVPTASLVTSTSVQWNALLTALAGSGVSLVVATYGHYAAGQPAGSPDATDVSAITVDSRWDTQRRRLNV